VVTSPVVTSWARPRRRAPHSGPRMRSWCTIRRVSVLPIFGPDSALPWSQRAEDES